jgi:hypothetical protein
MVDPTLIAQLKTLEKDLKPVVDLFDNLEGGSPLPAFDNFLDLPNIDKVLVDEVRKRCCTSALCT